MGKYKYTEQEGRVECCGKPMYVQARWKKSNGEDKVSFICSICGNVHKDESIKDRIIEMVRPMCCGVELSSKGSKMMKTEQTIKRFFACKQCGEHKLAYYNLDNTPHENQEPRKIVPKTKLKRDHKAERIARKIAKEEEKKARQKYLQPDPIPTPQLDPMMLWGLSMETRRSLSTNQRGLRA